MAEQRIHGIIPPVTTPFDASGDLDEGALAGQCRWLLERGVHGVTVAGSTGEGHTLSGEEARRAAAAAMQAVDGRAPVIAGIIANSTREVVRRGQALAINGNNLPACVKYAQSLQDCPAGLPRAPMPAANAAQQQAIAAALAALDSTP